MPDQTLLDEGTTQELASRRASALEQLEAAKAALEAAETRAAFWQRLSEYADKAWSVHMWDFLDSEVALLTRMRAEQDPAMPLLERLYSAARERSRADLRDFPALVETKAKHAGLGLNLEHSRHPVYYFHGRFFKAEVNETKRRVRLSTSEGMLAEMPADVSALLERVGEEERRVFGRRVTARGFMARVRKAYSAELKASSEQMGASIPIRRVMRRLQRTSKGFRRDEFVADLAQLVRDDRTAVDGFVMDLQQIKSATEGVLLPGLESRGYVGYMTFRRG